MRLAQVFIETMQIFKYHETCANSVKRERNKTKPRETRVEKVAECGGEQLHRAGERSDPIS